MYRCYGNYNIAIIKSEKGGIICKIATNVKNTFITAFWSMYLLINIVYWVKYGLYDKIVCCHGNHII